MWQSGLKRKFKLLFYFFLTSLLIGCATPHSRSVKVIDLGSEHEEAQGYHLVQPGETLYFIAWRFNRDFTDLAKINQLTRPYALAVGEKVYLSPNQKTLRSTQPIKPPSNNVTTVKPIVTPTIKSIEPPIKKSAAPPLPEMLNKPVKIWLRPAKGTVIEHYSATLKGINIAGVSGSPVIATAAGEVVYAGNGLRGYGNLILIKHNDIYLSAYAHNQRLLVREGEFVKAGQPIAEMGNTDSDKVMLHFELRQRGKPINPEKYIH